MKKDRLVGLKFIIGLIVIADAIALFAEQSGSYTFWSTGSTRYALSGFHLREGEWLRLFVGAFAGGSIASMIAAIVVVWWIGSRLAPAVHFAAFIPIMLTAAGFGAAALLVTRPRHYTFGGLSLVGASIGMYVVFTRRGRAGRLTLPNSSGLVWIGVILLWSVGSAVLSEPGAGVAGLAGFVVAAALGWLLVERVPQSQTANAAPKLAVLAVVSFAVAGAAAWAYPDAAPPTRAQSALEAMPSSETRDDRRNVSR